MKNRFYVIKPHYIVMTSVINMACDHINGTIFADKTENISGKCWKEMLIGKMLTVRDVDEEC